MIRQSSSHRPRAANSLAANPWFGAKHSKFRTLLVEFSNDIISFRLLQATPQVFEAIDLNQDKSLDHDEWHKFKAAYGLKHQD